MKKTSKIYNMFQYIALFGNAIYLFWILYNGINEGFNGGIVMIISSTGLMLLLLLNIALFYFMRNKSK